jgi:hypothetical protein
LKAALLYDHHDCSYFRSLGSMRNAGEKQMLASECLQTSQGIAIHPQLFFCPPQLGKYGKQCEAILQSPRVGGHKEFHTGLREVNVLRDAESPVSAVYVADYKANYRVQEAAPTAVILMGKPYGTSTGWMLVVVTRKTYRLKSRKANEATALATIEQVMPLLPEWLAQLPPADV